MNVSLHSTGLSNLAAPLLAVPVFEDEGQRGELFSEINGLLEGVPASLADEEGFEGKAGQTLLIHTPDASIRRVMLVGVGKAEGFNIAGLRKISSAAVQEADRRKLTSVAVALPGCDGVSDSDRLRYGTEGGILGAYRYETYLTQDVEPMTCEGIVLAGVPDDGSADETIATAVAVSEAVNLARDLVNGPPVEVTPSHMANVARSIAADNNLEVTIFDKAEIKRQGMNLLMAVSAGSEEEPRFIHLTYRPEGATDDTPQIALVGKGLTFDAGGYNLKPAGGIDDMKMDMAGGAAVLGAMKAISAVKPNYIVHGIVPSSENLISGAAYKVGDVFHSLNGKSVQVMNTDAEGRLILADALCYAERMGVDRIVDLATLTGACMVALGPHTAGLFTADDAFASRIEEAAERAGEDLWRLPLNKKLRTMLKSPIADMKNVGQRWGGAITAALFLQEFVGDVTWAHLDIAGPAFSDKADGYIPKGGTGYAVMSLIELIKGEV